MFCGSYTIKVLSNDSVGLRVSSKKTLDCYVCVVIDLCKCALVAFDRFYSNLIKTFFCNSMNKFVGQRNPIKFTTLLGEFSQKFRFLGFKEYFWNYNVSLFPDTNCKRFIRQFYFLPQIWV